MTTNLKFLWLRVGRAVAEYGVVLGPVRWRWLCRVNEVRFPSGRTRLVDL